MSRAPGPPGAPHSKTNAAVPCRAGGVLHGAGGGAAQAIFTAVPLTATIIMPLVSPSTS